MLLNGRVEHVSKQKDLAWFCDGVQFVVERVILAKFGFGHPLRTSSQLRVS